jgi:hypothetical protein
MPSPSSTPPVHALFGARMTELEQQLAQINAWIRTFSADSGWVNATLEHGWENLGGAYALIGYRKIGNIVLLRGGVKKGGASATTLFTLPKGFRPAYQEFPAVGAELSAPTELIIKTNGEVEALFGTSANFVLSSITFTTD